MDVSTVSLDLLCGWCTWSLGQNIGHRWWHHDMKQGAETYYAHGERQHHRVYDPHGQRAQQMAEDPQELFISFPLHVVAAMGLPLVAAFGWLRGWPHAMPFAGALYACMALDHQLHILFHKRQRLAGPLGWFQNMHKIHHATHTRNFFFVTGLVWDCLLGTAATRVEPAAAQTPRE
jgi:hypothetical protein